MSKESNPNVEEDLKELLKVPVGTYEAALEFRKSKDVSQVEQLSLASLTAILNPIKEKFLQIVMIFPNV